ncbi:MAG: UDP-N-acetylmuramate dehydrogenase, partial [Lachnospiraceae bacterium]|nr:UDP-N-acetylmuramate dehydrogenase [Lachnospiraceae bacterium]
MDEVIIREIKKRAAAVSADEPMSAHTTFRSGGEAACFAEPTGEELAALLSFVSAEKIPYFILGNGSNVLFSDAGFDGLVIGIGKNMSRIAAEGAEIRAEAGAHLSSLAKAALDNSLTGLEFASGIPGSVGGGVFMNAGAYGGELKDVILGVTALTLSGEKKSYSAKELELSYRHSIFSDKAKGEVVVSASFALTPGDTGEIAAKMQDLNARRREKQPLEYPSAGSTFKRPEGHFAGQLIQEAGLMGYAVGDAMVSTKHAGFVVNTGKASASDIFAVITHVQEKVYETSGVRLEPEVRLIGKFG